MSYFIKPKKYLGQHFLKDDNTAKKIIHAFLKENPSDAVLEIGAGTGALTKHLVASLPQLPHVIDIDEESVSYLAVQYPYLKDKLIHGDFLKFQPDEIFENSFSVIGNFPYNISSQILFKILEYKNKIPYAVGMFQKEVAERITSSPKCKLYGILSVLLQAFYTVDFLFTVSETVFVPPPKVKSAVVSFKRNHIQQLSCNEKLFFDVVKTAFNQRRKILRNALKKYLIKSCSGTIPFLSQRAEELSWRDFEQLVVALEMEK